MDITAIEGLPAVRAILPCRHRDARGFFSEVWRDDAMQRAGISARFVQENHALSYAVETIRGLHFQIGKAAQAKLVRCCRGSILDVAVDIRQGSPTFGRHVAVILSAENPKQLYVPGSRTAIVRSNRIRRCCTRSRPIMIAAPNVALLGMTPISLSRGQPE